MDLLHILSAASASAAPKAAAPPVAADPKKVDFSDFLGACLDRVETLDMIALAMMIVAILLALGAGAVAVAKLAKTPAGQQDGGDNAALKTDSISSVLAEAVSKLLETLGKLPVWFALFVGGFSLFWLASELSDGQCGNRTIVNEVAKSVAKSDKQESGAATPEAGADSASDSPEGQ